MHAILSFKYYDRKRWNKKSTVCSNAQKRKSYLKQYQLVILANYTLDQVVISSTNGENELKRELFSFSLSISIAIIIKISL